MPDDTRVQELLDRLSDSDATPEEVCGSCVELLPVVRERWRQMCRAREELDALFPPETESGAEQPDTATLPAVPGYEVEAELGRGGMGVVYRARHVRLNRVIALKMVQAGGPRERERFRREAEAAAALRHPNVVQVHDVGDADGRLFFTMEYLEGGSLAQRLHGKPLQIREAVGLVLALTGAVEAAHKTGIVHRDLKPANVLLTADGTPKVADFGLARRLDDEAGLTRTGTAVGTPSYMAPEQAGEDKYAPGPPADIYSLGAILYELLTGRPPFQAGNAAMTIYRAVTQDPVRPSQLNKKVSQDLETVCLKCLGKEPRFRYPSAAALGDDLRRFLDGEAIAARPEGPLARLARWVRRRPVLSAAVAVAVLSTAALGGVGAWTLTERSAAARAAEATDKAADDDLKEMVGLFRSSAWVEARAAWERASGRLGNSRSAALRRRLDQGKRDLDVVADLEQVRLILSGVRGDRSTESHSPEAMCATAFRRYGIDVEILDPGAAAAAVRGSDVNAILVEYLHEWLYWVSDGNRPRVQAVADLADDDGWRREYRAAIAAEDRDPVKLIVLAGLPATADQPPAILSGLCGGLLIHGHRAVALDVLTTAHRRHTSDFWINYLLGHFWVKDRPQHAVGYFRVAVALRPTSDQACLGLARALRDAGEAEEAAAAFGTALALNATTDVIKEWAKLLAPSDRLAEARAVWAKYLETAPPNPDAWYGYAQLCLFLEDELEYRRACNALFDRFETTSDGVVAERTSLAGLLRPAGDAQVRRACALAERAVAVSAEKDSPYLQFLSGLADYRLGRYDGAAAVLGAVAVRLPDRPGPRLVLAMAQFRAGSAAEAKRSLAEAVTAYDWRSDRADHTTAWVSHALRREAAELILPESATFLKGEFRPRDNDERLILLACSCVNRPLTAARLYVDAFAADPDLAADIKAGHRSSAARYAVLAGCGRGADAAETGEPERAKWRAQARQWLRADLSSLDRLMESDPGAARALGLKRLTEWRGDPDLSGVRDAAELSGLTQEERQDCRALWDQVETALGRCKC